MMTKQQLIEEMKKYEKNRKYHLNQANNETHPFPQQALELANSYMFALTALTDLAMKYYGMSSKEISEIFASVIL